jgi:hypothetical protein
MGRWEHILTDTVTVAAVTGIAAGAPAGDLSFGAQTTMPGRVEHKVKTLVGPDGNEVQADHVIVTESEITRGSKVWVPGDDTADANAGRRVIATQKASTPGGGDTLFEAYL